MTTYELIEAFEERGEMREGGIAYLDGERCPEMDVNRAEMELDPQSYTRF